MEHRTLSRPFSVITVRIGQLVVEVLGLQFASTTVLHRFAHTADIMWRHCDAGNRKWFVGILTSSGERCDAECLVLLRRRLQTATSNRSRWLVVIDHVARRPLVSRRWTIITTAWRIYSACLRNVRSTAVIGPPDDQSVSTSYIVVVFADQLKNVRNSRRWISFSCNSSQFHLDLSTNIWFSRRFHFTCKCLLLLHRYQRLLTFLFCGSMQSPQPDGVINIISHHHYHMIYWTL